MSKAKVYVGLPTGDDKTQATQLLPLLNIRNEGAEIIHTFCFSCVTFPFNWLWADALNARVDKGITHFLLLHADIVPESGFLKKMLSIMEKMKCDVLSAVVPLKSSGGLTSTGFIPNPDDEFMVRRFTLKEIFKFPETFTHTQLVVNTGIMLVDLRKPWVEKIYFTIQDKLERTVDGKGFIAKFQPEDWNFSIRARKLGALVYATRAVKCQHVGTARYDNCTPWGTCDIDPIWTHLPNKGEKND